MSEPSDTKPRVAGPGRSPERFWPRVFWVAVQIVVVLWFAQRGNLFFYQRF